MAEKAFREALRSRTGNSRICTSSLDWCTQVMRRGRRPKKSFAAQTKLDQEKCRGCLSVGTALLQQGKAARPDGTGSFNRLQQEYARKHISLAGRPLAGDSAGAKRLWTKLLLLEKQSSTGGTDHHLALVRPLPPQGKNGPRSGARNPGVSATTKPATQPEKVPK